MKNTSLIPILLVSLLTVTCEKTEHLVTYPESYPVFETAEVAEPSITYGDSISLNVSLSDKITPLSTLEVQVVVNSAVIHTETIRTKGNTSEISRRYSIPFVPNCVDAAGIKVYLSSINVDGYTTDLILNTTTAYRPEMPEIWVVPTSGKSYKLTLTDPENLLYHGTGMTYGNTVACRFATKVDKFNKVDWSGLVFGKSGDGIGLISQGGDPVTLSDPTLVGISEITFDALQFTASVSGKLLEPVTTLDIDVDLLPTSLDGKDFRGNNIYFGQGVEVTFTGLADLQTSLPPDYFEITGPNTAIFLGPDAIYKAYYYPEFDYLFVEPQPNVIYPEALWVCGTGMGRPAPPYQTTTSWNWNSPLDYAPCRLVSPGVYQFTVYLKNQPDGFGFGTCDFKFFFKRGWWDAAHEINASEYTVGEPLYGLYVEGKYGNVNGMTTPFEGVYKITLDMNAKTLTPVKIN